MLIDRRCLLGGVASMAAASALPGGARAAQSDDEAWAAADARYFTGSVADHGFKFRRTNLDAIDDTWRRQLVQYSHQQRPGTIIVDSKNHFLYVAYENNVALRYGVGVGVEGFKWYGTAQVARKQIWPGWTPPPEMLKRRPDLPHHMAGGPDNPLGPRAMYLYRNGQDLGYRLHGTLEPWTIGQDASSGCVRLLPEDVVDLYQRTPIGTKVVVLERLA
ncbi:L,D-transpeptidase [Lichenihabitans sp. Uapishka_5]|uniref:L,D-transpeptidase n=1 Tax=Lichenihabitans sp. Uapishka_5 TaxID=3037302 RepID=UPI003FA56206